MALKLVGKNEITWEVSGRVLGGGVILLQNLQQKRRGINPPFLLADKLYLYRFIASLSRFAAVNLIALQAGRESSSPVFGLRPFRAARATGANVPKPGRKIRSPSASASVNVSSAALMSFSASASVRLHYFLNRFTRLYLFM